MQIYSVIADVFVKDHGHLGIDGSHDLVSGLYNGDCKSGVMKIFSHLQADETASDHHCALSALVADHAADVVGVRNGPECENAGRINARNAGTQRGRTGRDDELVIALSVLLAGDVIFDADRFAAAVDRDGFVTGAHVDIKALAHDFGLCHQKCVAGLNDITDVIGKAAIGVGDVLAALQHDDLGFFVKPAQPGSAAGAGGYASDDQYFAHGISFLYENIVDG